MSLLSIKNVSRRFPARHGDVQALRDISLDVVQGECLAIVGESGSGKSTLANLILGILTPDAGDICLAGERLTHRRSHAQRRAIQLVQQNPLSAFNPRRSIGASIRLGLDTHRIGPAAGRARQVADMLEEVGLEASLAARRPAALSGGQRQRAGIARALVCAPQLIVLDEPTAALDVLVQARILRLLDDLRTRKGLTYIFISHDLAVIRNVADRVAVLRGGQLVELAPATRIFSAPRARATRELIGAVPVIDDAEDALRQKLAEAL